MLFGKKKAIGKSRDGLIINYANSLSNGLICCHMFNEPTGGLRTYDTANANYYTNKVGTNITTTQVPDGNGLLFPTANIETDRIEITNLNKTLGTNGGFTLNVRCFPYANTTSNAVGNFVVCKLYPYQDQEGDWALCHDQVHLNPPGWVFTLYNSGWKPSFLWNPMGSSGVAPAGYWYDVFLTHDLNNGFTMYQNGIQYGTTSTPGYNPTEATTHYVCVGHPAAAYSPQFYGKISWVKIWNRRLLPGEVRQLYEDPNLIFRSSGSRYAGQGPTQIYVDAGQLNFLGISVGGISGAYLQ